MSASAAARAGSGPLSAGLDCDQDLSAEGVIGLTVLAQFNEAAILEVPGSAGAGVAEELAGVSVAGLQRLSQIPVGPAVKLRCILIGPSRGWPR